VIYEQSNKRAGSKGEAVHREERGKKDTTDHVGEKEVGSPVGKKIHEHGEIKNYKRTYPHKTYLGAERRHDHMARKMDRK